MKFLSGCSGFIFPPASPIPGTVNEILIIGLFVCGVVEIACVGAGEGVAVTGTNVGVGVTVGCVVGTAVEDEVGRCVGVDVAVGIEDGKFVCADVGFGLSLAAQTFAT